MPKARMKPFRPDKGYPLAKFSWGGEIYEAGKTYDVTPAQAAFLRTVPEDHCVDETTGQPRKLSHLAFDVWSPEDGEQEPTLVLFGDEPPKPASTMTTEQMQQFVKLAVADALSAHSAAASEQLSAMSARNAELEAEVERLRAVAAAPAPSPATTFTKPPKR